MMSVCPDGGWFLRVWMKIYTLRPLMWLWTYGSMQKQLAIIQNGISVITLCTGHQPEKNELILPFSLYKHFVSSGHLE